MIMIVVKNEVVVTYNLHSALHYVAQKDTWIIITILSQQIEQINSIEHKKLVAWIFWANQGFLLAAEHTGGDTLLLIASINFLNNSSSAIAKRTGSLSLIIKITDNIFDNLRVKTLKLSSFLLWDLPLLAID